jgi:hypothetical protein
VNQTQIAACHPIALPRAIAYKVGAINHNSSLLAVIKSLDNKIPELGSLPLQMTTAEQGHGTARASLTRPFKNKNTLCYTTRAASLPVTAHPVYDILFY